MRLQLAELQQQRLPQMFVGVTPVGVVLLVGGLLAAGLALYSQLRADRGRRRIAAGRRDLCGVVSGRETADGGGICTARETGGRQRSAARTDRPHGHRRLRTGTHRSVPARRESETQRADDLRHQQSATKINAEQQQRLTEVETKYQPLASDLQSRRQRELASLDEKHPRQLTVLEEQFHVDQDQATAKHRRRQSENQRRRDRDYDSLATQWQEGFSKFLAGVDAITARDAALFPPWDQMLQGDWNRRNNRRRASALGSSRSRT